MDTPNIHQIKTMTPEERNTLNSKLAKRLAGHMVGMVFLKLAVPTVLGVLARKALIKAAKKA